MVFLLNILFASATLIVCKTCFPSFGIPLLILHSLNRIFGFIHNLRLIVQSYCCCLIVIHNLRLIVQSYCCDQVIKFLSWKRPSNNQIS